MLASRSTSEKLPWKLLSLEAVLVVLSVLLALALNSWREARGHERLAHRAVQTVVDEAQANCLLVQNLLPYHRAVFAGEEDYEGLGEVLLRNDAWTSAQSAGAAHHIDYGVAAAVGAVHALQVDHRRLVEAGLQASYIAAASLDPHVERFPPDGDLDWIPGPHPLMLGDLLRIQDELLETYEDLFSASERRYGIEAPSRCGGVPAR
jgi:hypothetical protein